MKNVKTHSRVHMYIGISIVLAAAVLMRLLPHPYNFTPVAALALFGGVYLNRRLALVLPLSVMLVSDLFLGFHDTFLFVYGSFVLTGLLGMWLRTRNNVRSVFLAAITSSLLFFFITNFGVWVVGTMYPKTVHGLFESYLMGLPFLRNTVLGDLFYTGVFFGGYELGKRLLVSPAPLLHFYENLHKNR